ncbi:MAG: tetratricopeptide repeat protein [Gemmatimonadetes bacterium]|nr:tetratricopeptide repeat protein [Gemmatimonadota bacterium]MXY81732.1 tetratricopeptide repeat protein [Gemmatimonadota bacterium]MYB67907.1 tetratricopeptide repeat protein [Gemmatimonadota bacterium]
MTRYCVFLVAACFGCSGGEAPTFNRDIAPIVFHNCAPCHRPAGPAPFDLLSYENVSARAEQIAFVTETRYMPPWKPKRSYGSFAGERGLSAEQIATIRRWVERGKQEGQSADLPPLPRWESEWELGQPDLIASMTSAYTLRADGPDVFRNFAIPLPVDSTRYVKALEFRPGNARIVHHATMMIDRSGAARRRDGRDGAPGFDGMSFGEAEDADGHFLGWTQGKTPYPGSDSLAWRLDPSTDLLLQLHMLPTGKEESIEARVGLFFADAPPKRRPAMLRLGRKDIDIPAGASDHWIRDTYRLPVDVEVLTIYPHAHYLGREIRAYAELPDGEREWLIWIEDWDFSWQDDYRFSAPVFLPAGATLVMEYAYDNSAQNPRQPHDPPVRVRYGLHSTDEMGDLTLQILPRRPEDRERLRRDFYRKWLGQEIDGYKKLLEADPQDWDTHHTLAMFYMRSGQRPLALEHFELALEYNPDYPEAHVNFGIALAQGREWEQAIAHLERALQRNPDFAEAHFNLGLVLEMLGRSAEAKPHFDAVIRQRPDMAEAIQQRLAKLRR